MKKILWVLLLAISFSSAQAAGEANALQRAIVGKQRSAEHKARDQYRHPQQTLEFFDVKDNMTVVEIWPGEGWYTKYWRLI
jgi:predicted methyltransferase